MKIEDEESDNGFQAFPLYLIQKKSCNKEIKRRKLKCNVERKKIQPCLERKPKGVILESSQKERKTAKDKAPISKNKYQEQNFGRNTEGKDSFNELSGIRRIELAVES